MSTFSIDEESSVLVELTAPPGVQQVALQPLKPEEIVQRSEEALQSAMSTIHRMARRFVATVQTLEVKPSEVEVEFGLKLTSEGNALIARTGLEGSLTVKLTWKSLGGSDGSPGA